jgi:Flp pilus assembly protein TadD
LHAQAISELQRATSLSGDSPIYVAQVGVAYAAAGKNGEALGVIAQADAFAGAKAEEKVGLLRSE